jgi:hypothetical protein
MSPSDIERRIRALAQTADLPRDTDPWPGVSDRLPQVRKRARQRVVRRRVLRGAVAVLAVSAAAVAIPVALSNPPGAMAAAERAAAVARTGAGLPPFELTVTTTTTPTGFQPEPPPPLTVAHIEYADASHWRMTTVITEPSGEGPQQVTQIRDGARIATVASGQTTISSAGQGQLPGTWPGKLQTARSAGRCAPSTSLDVSGPVIDGRPTVVLHLGASPCPSADTPQSDGSATFWLDRQTFLVLAAVLHGPRGQVAETIKVTGLRYHPAFPPATFRLPAPSHPPAGCHSSSHANGALLASSLPAGWRAGQIVPGATTGNCDVTSFTVTYLDRSGRPAAQLYEAPRSSPSVRFPGHTVTITPGLTGTLDSGNGMTILWWIQDDRYCSLQSGGVTAGVSLALVPAATLLRMAASFRA